MKATDTPVHVGGGWALNYMQGRLDSVAVYNYSISSNDILSNAVWRVPTNYLAVP